jgi:hypothetical protein
LDRKYYQDSNKFQRFVKKCIIKYLTGDLPESWKEHVTNTLGLVSLEEAVEEYGVSMQIQPTNSKIQSTVNRIPVMVPLTAPLFGVISLGGISPSKIGPIAPS